MAVLRLFFGKPEYLHYYVTGRRLSLFSRVGWAEKERHGKLQYSPDRTDCLVRRESAAHWVLHCGFFKKVFFRAHPLCSIKFPAPGFQPPFIPLLCLLSGPNVSVGFHSAFIRMFAAGHVWSLGEYQDVLISHLTGRTQLQLQAHKDLSMRRPSCQDTDAVFFIISFRYAPCYKN